MALAFIPILLVLAGCATPTLKTPSTQSAEVRQEEHKQRVAYVKALIDEQERVARVAHQIAVNTVDLCGGRSTLTTGAYFFDWDLTTDEWVDIANEAIGINLHTPGIEILMVMEDSPAEEAGILPGDRVVRLNDWAIPSGKGSYYKFIRRLRILSKQSQDSIKLTIQRDAEFIDVNINSVPACEFPVVLQDDETINAYADGRKVVINRGMLRYAQSDDELALVIGHEFSHNALGHIDAKMQNLRVGAHIGMVVDILFAAVADIDTRWVGAGIGATIGAHAYSKEFEAEADYLGAYMIARSNYDLSKMPDFWRKMGVVDPSMIEYAGFHPTTAERTIAMERIVQEIRTKKRAGLALTPELK